MCSEDTVGEFHNNASSVAFLGFALSVSVPRASLNVETASVLANSAPLFPEKRATMRTSSPHHCHTHNNVIAVKYMNILCLLC